MNVSVQTVSSFPERFHSISHLDSCDSEDSHMVPMWLARRTTRGGYRLSWASSGTPTVSSFLFPADSFTVSHRSHTDWTTPHLMSRKSSISPNLIRMNYLVLKRWVRLTVGHWLCFLRAILCAGTPPWRRGWRMQLFPGRWSCGWTPETLLTSILGMKIRGCSVGRDMNSMTALSWLSTYREQLCQYGNRQQFETQ